MASTSAFERESSWNASLGPVGLESSPGAAHSAMNATGLAQSVQSEVAVRIASEAQGSPGLPSKAQVCVQRMERTRRVRHRDVGEVSWQRCSAI
jgi:hypothetical protein